MKTVKIGNVFKTISKARNPELVPNKYLQEINQEDKTIIKHLQWMLQKDNLSQDIFLIGPSGPLKRRLVMSFAELTNREIEYVPLTRDTTESDLKQRREIIQGDSIYIDQTALKAATFGRILVLDGIEKTERNVLPILNNLLENREMQLEDGRFLMRSELYDNLLEKHSQSSMDLWKFVRCSPHFRVVAIGLSDNNRSSSKGNPLDPPLRSRFQSRFIAGQSYEESINRFSSDKKNDGISAERISKLVSFGHAVRCSDDLPTFSLDNLTESLSALQSMPDWKLIDHIYPFELLLSESSGDRKSIIDLMSKFGLELKSKNSRTDRNFSQKLFSFSLSNTERLLGRIILTQQLQQIVSEMKLSQSIGDFCVIGASGAGKSIIIDALSSELHSGVTRVALYGEMTPRQLLQQRDTNPMTGDTVWRNSALVRAALAGRWAILDGLQRLEPGCVALLAQLASDRHLQLFDGTRLVRHDRYDTMKQENGCSDADMAAKGIYRIHPDFRIIALAEPPSIPGESSNLSSSSRTEWLSSEIMSSLRFHVLPEISRLDEQQIISKLVPNITKVTLDKLLNVVHKLRTSDDPHIRELSQNLSLRQVLRISHRLSQYPSETISNSIHKACLSKFLPKLVQDSLQQSLEQFDGIKTPESLNKLSDSEQLQQLIGKYRKSIHPIKGALEGEEEAKVPNIVFYDSIAHTRILLEMLQDFMMDGTYKDRQHLLLIGNQGVGKNKIVDRFLQLLNRSREYIQLHRDTTVQTLTLQPSIKDGKLIYEDSALVKAITKGRVLVVDEADKASTQVTCILKILISMGEMELSDGRYVVPDDRDISYLSKEEQERIIRIHPDFRMIVLANRPGFPFLGNDFFGAMGDVFSCHAVDNPDVASEILMLQKYGPSVPVDMIKKLVFLFTDLRQLADQGQINYPYSTREIVNIVRHLEKYPNDGLSVVLGNVFDFDVSNKEMLTILENTLEKHGISLPGTQVKVVLAKEMPLPQPVNIGKLNIDLDSVKKLPVVFHSSSKQSSMVLNLSKMKIDKHISRSRAFSELDECIGVKLGEYNIVSDFLTSGAEEVSDSSNAFIHFITLNPIVLTTITVSKDDQGVCNKLSSCNFASQIDLSDIFPPVQGSFRPFIKLSALPSPFDTSVLLFEATTNRLLQIDTSTGNITNITSDCLLENKIKLRPMWFNNKEAVKNQIGNIKMHRDWSTNTSESTVIFHKPGEEYFRVFHPIEKTWHSVTVGIPVQTLNMVNKDQWLIQDVDNKFYIVSRNGFSDLKYQIYEINSSQKSISTEKVFIDDINTSDLHKSLAQSFQTPVVWLAKSKDSYVDIMSKFALNNEPVSLMRVPRNSVLSSEFYHPSTSTVLPSSGVIVTCVEKNDVPKQFRSMDSLNYTTISGYLEVVDVKSASLKYLQIPSVFAEPKIFQWLKINIPNTFAARLNNDIVTLDNTGCIHKWTVCPIKLQNELSNWKSDIGLRADDMRDVMIERLDEDVKTDLSGPKHGKVDPTGAPHVGGNTWAGGTGGRDTAGLGGIGGPYRLDAGHNVFQVSDNIKAAVPDHVRAAAREMGQKAWKERLNQIHMSELDYDLYMRYYKKVESQIVTIRSILDSLQAASKERKWIRHRTHGDLDEGKLVEGVLGEKSIYRTRGKKDPEPGSPQIKPKRFRVICDLSGSMYRFNGHDQRLERQLEAILMLMESFVNVKKEKLIYDIYGHSGEGPQFPFVKLNQPPANEKQRMDVLSEMVAHSQFCLSGDHTVEAIDKGIKDLRKDIDSVDQSFLVVLSDANLSRYGIPASSISKLLLNDKEINTFIIFIGSLGDQAQMLKKALPLGHAFVCMDIEMLPQILRQIFTANVFS